MAWEAYREVWEQTETEVVAQVKAEPDVIAYGALIEAALARAEQLLAEE